HPPSSRELAWEKNQTGSDFMSAEQVGITPEPVGTQRAEKNQLQPSPRRSRRGLRALILLILLGTGIGGVYLVSTGRERSRGSRRETAAAESGGWESAGAEPRVQVVEPHPNGMERTTKQPGTLRAFRYAPLYAKISGYLDKLNVDRGSRVKK